MIEYALCDMTGAPPSVVPLQAEAAADRDKFLQRQQEAAQLGVIELSGLQAVDPSHSEEDLGEVCRHVLRAATISGGVGH